MSQYKVSLHYNGLRSFWCKARTLIWDKEERPIQINRLVRKKITGKLVEDFINLKTKDNGSNTLKELTTTQLGRLWIKEINESRVREYETKP